MEKVKVLIVDDSGVYRSMIRSVFEDIGRFEIIAAVGSGILAIEKLLAHQIDLLVLDLEMPDLDGIGTLREMNKRGIKCKTLVFSSLSKYGAQCTMDALNLGATDFVTKPGHDDGSTSPMIKIKNAIMPKVQGLFPENHATTIVPKVESKIKNLRWEVFRPKIILIGSSTGGPTVLERIFSQLHGDLNCPIVITQHMPPTFTATLAERLSRNSGLQCAEAKDGERIEKNRVYIAPGDYHLRLRGTAEEAYFSLDQGPQIQSVRPAVDPMFETASVIYKDKCLAMVLTGMGYDGRDGAREIKKQGGLVAIQEKNSCTVFGMPGAVYEAGLYDVIESPDELAKTIKDKAFSEIYSSASSSNLSRKIS